MANQRPVEDPVGLIYTGGQRANAIVGPVTGNGYPAKIGEEQPVERGDVDELLATGLWARPPAPPKKSTKAHKKESE